MNKILPDSNVWIRYFAADPRVVGLVEEAIVDQAVVIPTVVAFEFFVKATMEQMVVMEEICRNNLIVNLDMEVAKRAAWIRKELLAKDRRRILIDCIVMASARLHKAEVITFDARNFVNIPMKVKVLEV